MDKILVTVILFAAILRDGRFIRIATSHLIKLSNNCTASF